MRKVRETVASPAESLADTVVDILTRQKGIAALQDAVQSRLPEQSGSSATQSLPHHHILGFSAAVFDASSADEQSHSQQHGQHGQHGRQGVHDVQNDMRTEESGGLLRWPEDVQQSSEHRKESGARLSSQRRARLRTRGRSRSNHSSPGRGVRSRSAGGDTRAQNGVLRGVTSELARGRGLLHNAVADLNAIVHAHKVTLADETSAWAAAERRRQRAHSSAEVATSPHNRHAFAEALQQKLVELSPQR